MGSYPNPVFIGCTKLASVIIDDNVKTIPQNAFWGCTGLTNITIPSSITSIGDYAFYGCSSLTSITIPSSVTSIGSGAFMLCAGLIYVDANNPNYTSQDGLLYNKAMTTLIKCPLVKTGEFSIPSSITSIGDYAFYGCTGLTSINIPQSVNTIGNVSFQGCTGLINIDANNPNYASLDGLLYNKTMTTLIQCPLAKTGNLTIPSFVTSIGSNAFFSCSHLTTITIPSSVLSIGSGAFSNCTGLSNITIPSSVTSIGDLAFQGCTGLTTVNFNAIYCTRMGSLSYPVFSGCTNLTNVIIGDIVNIIPAYAFIVCRGLTSITFPSSVTSIGSNAFSDCTGITTIYTYATVPVSLWGNSGVFYNVNKITCILYVPKGSLSAYKAADFWNDFVNIVEFDASAVNTPNDTKLKLIYNPAAGSLQLNGLDSPVLVSVYDLNGHLCLSRTVRAGETLPVQSLPRGIYVVKAVLNNEVMSRKVVI